MTDATDLSESPEGPAEAAPAMETRTCAWCKQEFSYPAPPKGSGRRPKYCPKPRKCQAEAKAHRAAERTAGMEAADAAYRAAGEPVVEAIKAVLDALGPHREAMSRVEADAIARAEEAEEEMSEAVERAQAAEAAQHTAEQQRAAAEAARRKAEEARQAAERAKAAAELERDTEVDRFRKETWEARSERRAAEAERDAAKQATATAQAQAKENAERAERHGRRADAAEQSLKEANQKLVAETKARGKAEIALATATADLAAATVRVQRLETDNTALTARISELETERDAAVDDRDRALNRAEDAERRTAETTAALEAERGRARDLAAAAASAKEEAEALRAEIEALRRQHAAELARLEAERDGATAAAAAAEIRFQTLVNRLPAATEPEKEDGSAS
jgi:hypothetical protein